MEIPRSKPWVFREKVVHILSFLYFVISRLATRLSPAAAVPHVTEQREGGRAGGADRNPEETRAWHNCQREQSANINISIWSDHGAGVSRAELLNLCTRIYNIYLFADEEARTQGWEISKADITSCSPDSKAVQSYTWIKSSSHPLHDEPFHEALIG